MTEELLKDVLELLREMVRIPSLSSGEEKVAAHISARLDGWGIAHRTCSGNIIALNRHYDPAKKTLALDAHIDTVPVNNGYTRDPFDPGEEPGRIWGLGANDDGASVVSMIAVFRRFYERELPVNLMLVLTREEERGGSGGARWLYAPEGLFATDPALPEPAWVIVGEPTGMKAASSERGLLVLDGEAAGVSGHAARGEGENALYKALDDIQALREHRFARISPMMGEIRLNVTQIQAGTAHNVIPDRCRFVVDIRPTEQYTNREILDELQALCRSRLTARNLANRSSATPPGSPLLRTAAALGITTFSSPTTSDWMHVRTDAIKLGPGDSSRSHKADEYIETAEIEEAIRIYSDFIERFYGNTLE